MNLLIDCSFIMASILPDELSSPLEYHAYKLYVPAIFFLECNNVLLTNLQRKRINEAEYAEYLSIIGDLPLNVDKFSTTRESTYSIGKLAREHKLTSYDASYLELALRINAHAITLDKALHNAYIKNRVKVLPL